MKKTAQSQKTRVGRPEGRKPLLNLRIERDILDQLKAAASQHPGRTVAEETVSRLRRSLSEDEYLSGPEMKGLANIMSSNFAFVAKQTAVADGHPDWKAKEWLADQNCYRAAALHVCFTLLEGMPGRSVEEMTDALLALQRKLAIDLARRGEIEGGSGFIKPKDEQL